MLLSTRRHHDNTCNAMAYAPLLKKTHVLYCCMLLLLCCAVYEILLAQEAQL